MGKAVYGEELLESYVCLTFNVTHAKTEAEGGGRRRHRKTESHAYIPTTNASVSLLPATQPRLTGESVCLSLPFPPMPNRLPPPTLVGCSNRLYVLETP